MEKAIVLAVSLLSPPYIKLLHQEVQAVSHHTGVYGTNTRDLLAASPHLRSSLLPPRRLRFGHSNLRQPDEGWNDQNVAALSH